MAAQLLLVARTDSIAPLMRKHYRCIESLEDLPFQASVQAYLEEISATSGIRAIFLGVSVGGERRFFSVTSGLPHQYVQEPSEVPFRIGCLVKPLLAAASLELSCQNELDISQSLNSYLPEFRAEEKGRTIAVRHLISHTVGYSGIQAVSGPGRVANRERFFSRICKAPQVFRPGVVFNYEQSGTSLLGEILWRISGQSIYQLIDELVLGRIGASLRCSNDSLQSSELSLQDVLSFAEVLMETCEAHESHRPALALSTIHGMRNDVIQIPRSPFVRAGSLLPIAYGLGLAKFHGNVFGHDGRIGSQAIGFRFNPDQSVAIALGIQAPMPHLRTLMLNEIFRRVCRLTADKVVICPRPFRADELSGKYSGNENAEVEVHVNLEQPLLTYRPIHGPSIRMEGNISASSELTFRHTNFSLEPSFFREPDTNEPCVMLGMCSFKRMSTLGRRGTGYTEMVLV